MVCQKHFPRESLNKMWIERRVVHSIPQGSCTFQNLVYTSRRLGVERTSFIDIEARVVRLSQKSIYPHSGFPTGCLKSYNPLILS